MQTCIPRTQGWRARSSCELHCRLTAARTEGGGHCPPIAQLAYCQSPACGASPAKGQKPQQMTAHQLSSVATLEMMRQTPLYTGPPQSGQACQRQARENQPEQQRHHTRHPRRQAVQTSQGRRPLCLTRLHSKSGHAMAMSANPAIQIHRVGPSNQLPCPQRPVH